MMIAEALVSGALEELTRLGKPARIVRVSIAVGELHQVVEDNLRMACEVLARGTPMEGAPIEIRHVPIIVKCRHCRWQGPIEWPFFVCGECGGGYLDVLSGRELHLERLEIKSDDDGNQSLQRPDGG